MLGSRSPAAPARPTTVQHLYAVGAAKPRLWERLAGLSVRRARDGPARGVAGRRRARHGDPDIGARRAVRGAGPTPVRLGDRAHDREPEADPIVSTCGVGAGEALPRALQEAGWKSGTVVGHVELDKRVVRARGQADVRGGVAQAIGHEVVERLPDP